MNRNVEINIPMFIGIILLVAVITTILVYGVNAAKNLMEKNNNKYTSTVNGIEDWFNTTEEVDTTEESSNLFNINTHIINDVVNDVVNAEKLV